MALVYIVEDDFNIREIEEYALKNAGYEIRSFADAHHFFFAMAEQLPQLVILDVMLPDRSGNEILRTIREDPISEKIPVVMVTALTSELDAVKAFDYGADDYIRKPFSVMEFVSRVNRLLKQETYFYESGEIRMDLKGRHVYVKEEEILLTYKEYELLLLLMKNKGIVMQRDRILQEVWDYDYEGESRTLDMHIVSLRQKLGIEGTRIKTIRNVGYVIE